MRLAENHSFQKAEISKALGNNIRDGALDSSAVRKRRIDLHLPPLQEMKTYRCHYEYAI